MPHYKGHSGINWHFESEGEGDQLLFIHGWGVDKRIWRQQSKFFSQYYKVTAFDLPGHGKSSWVKLPLEEMVQDLVKIFTHLDMKQLTIVSSSLGGLFALKIHELWPDRLAKLSFIGSMPKFSSNEEYPYGLDVQEMRKLGGQLDTAYPTIIDIFFRSLFTKEERSSRRFKWLQKFRQTDEKPIKQALVEYLDILEHEDLRNVLKRVTLPMQFITGAEDTICCPKTVNYLKTLCPQSRYDEFEQCGHFPFLSKPHEFNQVLNEFLLAHK